jgi:hypothetical protein
MTSDELVQLMVAVEARFPVDTWRIGGLHVWPLVRYELSTRNYYMYRRSDPASGEQATSARRLSARAAHLKTLGLRWAKWARMRTTDRVHEDRLRPADLLLYSDGVSFIRVEDEGYDRFCDPIVEAAAARGLSTVTLTPSPIDLSFDTRRSRSVLIQPALDAISLFDSLRTRLRPPSESDEQLTSYDDAIEWMKTAAGRELIVPSRELLRRIVVHVRSFASLYKRMLRRIRPKAVFVVCYYGAERMAMLLAARELGIPSVDVQHGVTGAAHWAYARWKRLPAEGYELLPSFFWCWDESDVLVVSEWSSTLPTFHRAVCAGNLYLDQWRAGVGPFVEECARRVREISAAHRGHKQVLYTASGLETPTAIRELAEVVRSTKDELFWWIRMHPCRLEGTRTFESALEEVSGTNWCIGAASELPLYALLRDMDIHVTEASSTVVEAAEFGIPSVLASEAEAPLFPELVRSGWILPVASFAAVPQGIRAQLGERDALVARTAAREPREAAETSGFDAILRAVMPS